MTTLTAILSRDLKIALRHKGQLLYAPAFFVLTILLFPLALGPDQHILSTAAPGLLATAALLASLLPLDRLFRDDRDDGTLDVLITEGASLPLYVAGKVTAHWLLTGLLLVLISPALVIMLTLGPNMIVPALVILLPLTIALSLIGALGTALAMGTRQGSVLLALLCLPLYIPVLIFGAGGLTLALLDQPMTTPLLFLWALIAAALPIVPLAVGAILKGQLE